MYLYNMLIEIDNKIISSEIFERKFVCDLSVCKGACCVEGDAGAPLKNEEVLLLTKNIEKIIPYMRAEGIKAIQSNGISCTDAENETTTSLIDGKECAFVHFDDHHVAKCAIETAYLAGSIPNLKPLSCHLYPIRIKEFNNYTAVNYDEWKICAPACVCGEKLSVPVYRFLKAPLIRAFGDDFYQTLETIAIEINNLD